MMVFHSQPRFGDTDYESYVRCDQFRSLHILQAVFVSEELRPFRDRLREADNLDARIRLNVDYLLFHIVSISHYGLRKNLGTRKDVFRDRHVNYSYFKTPSSIITS